MAYIARSFRWTKGWWLRWWGASWWRTTPLKAAARRDGTLASVRLYAGLADLKLDVESNWIAWLTCSVLTALFVLGATANASVLYLAHVARAERVPSMVPLFPGLLGLVGLGVCPIPRVAEHAWLALILDVSFIPTLLLGVPSLLLQAWRTSRFNRVHRYESLNCDDGRVSIELYRRGIGVVVKGFHLEPGQPGLLRSSTVWQWTLAGASLVLSREGGRVCFRQDQAGTLECVDREESLFFPGLRLARRQ